jgi:hypothetical protein
LNIAGEGTKNFKTPNNLQEKNKKNERGTRLPGGGNALSSREAGDFSRAITLINTRDENTTLEQVARRPRGGVPAADGKLRRQER